MNSDENPPTTATHKPFSRAWLEGRVAGRAREKLEALSAASLNDNIPGACTSLLRPLGMEVVSTNQLVHLKSLPKPVLQLAKDQQPLSALALRLSHQVCGMLDEHERTGNPLSGDDREELRMAAADLIRLLDANDYQLAELVNLATEAGR